MERKWRKTRTESREKIMELGWIVRTHKWSLQLLISSVNCSIKYHSHRIDTKGHKHLIASWLCFNINYTQWK